MSVRSRRVAGGPCSGGAQPEVARSRLSRLRDIERGKYALISHYASLVPQRRPPPGVRNRVYETMCLRVFARRDDILIAGRG